MRGGRCPVQLEPVSYTHLNSDNLGIGLYDESMSAIVMIPTLDENREFYMSRTKTALDTCLLYTSRCV